MKIGGYYREMEDPLIYAIFRGMPLIIHPISRISLSFPGLNLMIDRFSTVVGFSTFPSRVLGSQILVGGLCERFLFFFKMLVMVL
jgi:hypothetical protein